MSNPHTCSERVAMAACQSIKACDAFVLLLISLKAQFKQSFEVDMLADPQHADPQHADPQLADPYTVKLNGQP